MDWLLALMAILFLVDAIQMRRKIEAIPKLPPNGDNAEGFTAVVADGSSVSVNGLAAAADHARAHKLDAVDLIPADLSTLRVLSFVAATDPTTYRTRPFAPGRSAGCAIVMTSSFAERTDTTDAAAPLAFAQHATAIKLNASRTMDFAICDGVRESTENAGDRAQIIRHYVATMAPMVVAVKAVLLLAIAVGLSMPEHRMVALGTLLAFHLQPAIAISGTGLAPRDFGLVCALRFPLEVWQLLAMVPGFFRPDAHAIAIDAARPEYDALLADGLPQYFEPRLETCPLCDHGGLSVHLKSPDLVKQKPGEFILERCGLCEHIFQNPQLNVAGLNFYYKDFYDGLGESTMDTIFGHDSTQYVDRAQMVRGITVPKRWLDVGAGHGHFAHVAKEHWPDTIFHGLDLSESIAVAEHRGWISKGIMALFPDVADDHKEAYDMVSMHHYLEHTREPVAEIEAAAVVLEPGGHLLIEVPDPECKYGTLLGIYWMPWFQPQHLHLVSQKNLIKMLDEAGFDVVETDTAKAHQPIDLLFTAILFMNAVSKDGPWPWIPKHTLADRLQRMAVSAVGVPTIVVAGIVDKLIAPIVSKNGYSNTYRMLAKKRG